MFTNNEKEVQEKNYIEILDKLLELEKKTKKVDPIKITICVVAGIGSIMLIALICHSFLQSRFSIESILSTLLAFFSIFISIFFYFKANDTSTNFYNSSYQFMKDISVTLGKIEERFGEKLNSLNDKVSHLDIITSETSEEIKDKEDDKDNIINDLLDKANLKEEEKERYRKELAEKDKEIEMLRTHRHRAEREAMRLRRRISEIQNEENRIPRPPRSMLLRLLRTHDTSDLTSRGFSNLQALGFLDDDGGVNEAAIIESLDEMQ